MHRQGHPVRGTIALVCVLALVVTCRRAMADSYAGQTVIMPMAPPPSGVDARDAHIDYNIDPTQEHFLVKVPGQYTDNTPCGLLIYLGSDDQVRKILTEWRAALDQRKLIFVAPEQAGKGVAAGRRLGLAVYAALGAERQWNIDHRRVFVAGYGDGARIAGLLGFYAPDIFSGSIQMCGADFYMPVAQVEGKPIPGDSTPYGMLLSDATASEINAAKSFRFAFMTGQDDPRHGQIADIVHGGYVKNGFQCTLMNVPGIGQELCAPRRLDLALDYLEGIKTVAGDAPTTEPTPPAWMAKDPSEWPRILMSNQLIYPDGGVGNSGSSSLARLPNGVVVLCTARHLLGVAKLADFPTLFKSWTAYGALRSDGVRMTRVAMDLNQPASFDALVLCSASQDESWPGTVLPIRQEPLEIGDTVYLVAVPHGQSRDHQDVFKGIVVKDVGDKQLEYTVDGDFDTMGCSGAPVVDEYGRLAAINVGHLVNQTIPGKKQLTCISASDVLKAIELPPDVYPVEDASALPPAASAAGPQNLANQRANAALRGAQLYLDNQMYAKAREKLQDIIDVYPTTDAAQKARVLLTQIPNQ